MIERGLFSHTYEANSKGLWFYILKSTRNETLTDDIFQETFYRFIRANPQNLQAAQEKKYLYTTASRLIIDHYRRSETKNSNELNEELEGNDPLNHTANFEIEKLFSILPAEERSLLWLAYAEEYSHAEIASITGIKEKTVKVKLHRIKKRIKTTFGENGVT